MNSRCWVHCARNYMDQRRTTGGRPAPPSVCGLGSIIFNQVRGASPASWTVLGV